MSTLASLYNFKNIEDDKEGMVLASKFDRATGEVVEDLTAWVHTIAVRFNNPKMPMTAAKDYEEYMVTLEKYITSSEAGEYQWTKSNGHRKDFSLSGNTNVANAYKRSYNAIKLGGDLVESESKLDYGNELTTVSKCEKFVTKRNAQIKKDGEIKQAADELHQLIEEESGHERGTPEHEEIFQERSMQLVESSDDSKANSVAKDQDIYDVMGHRFADALRKVRDAGEGLDVIQQIADRAVDRITGTVTKLRAALEAVNAA